MNNLIQRTLSGVVYVGLIVGSILWNPGSFAGLFAVVTAMAVYEFHKLTNRQEAVRVNQACAVIGGLLLFAGCFLYASTGRHTAPVFWVYILFVAGVMIAELFRKQPNPVYNWAHFLLGQVMVALPFSLLNFLLFNSGAIVLLALFVTIWVNDTGAYLTGMTLGRHRLFERVSPKKTWEGFVGGAVFALLSGYVFSRFVPELSLVQWLIFSEIIVVFGTLGDLMESLLKRTLGVKDSGKLIPGHGGLLDRFDSLLLAAPVVLIYLTAIANFWR